MKKLLQSKRPKSHTEKVKSCEKRPSKASFSAHLINHLHNTELGSVRFLHLKQSLILKILRYLHLSASVRCSPRNSPISQ